MTLPRDLLLTTQDQIEALVANQVREGPHLDFKRELPGAWSEAAKHEFMADATAFANSAGGDLVFGIEEDGNAQASAVIPQILVNVDQEVRRLQDFLVNLADPRVPGVQVHAAPVNVGGTAGHVLIVRVPQSWVGPHRVRTNQHFFVREGSRKRQLDVPEIRGLFLRSENQAQRLRDFRTERLGKLLSGESPHPLVDGPLLVVHLVPSEAAVGLMQIKPSTYVLQRRLPLLGAATDLAWLNIDGPLVVRHVNQSGQTHGYTQFFRNGYLESTYVLTDAMQDGRRKLASLDYEEHIIKLLKDFRAELDLLAFNTECTVMISLLRADEIRFGVRVGFFEDLVGRQTLFDRRTLVVPDIVASSELPEEQALKPAFDLVWQAAGFLKSGNYNNAGQWAPVREF